LNIFQFILINIISAKKSKNANIYTIAGVFASFGVAIAAIVAILFIRKKIHATNVLNIMDKKDTTSKTFPTMKKSAAWFESLQRFAVGN
jgi:hypothetical protein